MFCIRRVCVCGCCFVVVVVVVVFCGIRGTA